jgi:5-methylcytosine-specific restriction protein B
MLPDPNVVAKISVGNLSIKEMMTRMNRRIEVLYDREHTIGHAYFMPLKTDNSMETLAEIFRNKVIPLLQEYFYEDYEKIQLVLGDNAKDDQFKFILDKPLKIKDIFSGSPDIDLPEKGYTIQHDAFRKLESYKMIGKDL